MQLAPVEQLLKFNPPPWTPRRPLATGLAPSQPGCGAARAPTRRAPPAGERRLPAAERQTRLTLQELQRLVKEAPGVARRGGGRAVGLYLRRRDEEDVYTYATQPKRVLGNTLLWLTKNEG